MTLRSIRCITLFHFTSIFLLTVMSVRDTSAGFTVGAPLTCLWDSSIDWPFSQTFRTRRVLVAITACHSFRTTDRSRRELQDSGSINFKQSHQFHFKQRNKTPE